MVCHSKSFHVIKAMQSLKSFKCMVAPLCRHISYTKLSNKRITRLESDIEIDKSQRLINRNPRNLELTSFESKPNGFWLDKSPPCDSYKLHFEQKGRYLEASVQHWSGKKLVQASTSEPNLLKYFNNPNTTQAAITLGQVISQRCLQAGYIHMGIEDLDEKVMSPKSEAFFRAVKSNGIVLEEPAEIVPRSITDL